MRFGKLHFSLLMAGALAVSPILVSAQTAPPSRILGPVTAIQGQSITVKPAKGAAVTFTVDANARVLETKPGAKTLAGATAIPVSGIAVGDRVLAMFKPGASGAEPVATTVIAMKQAALTAHQESEEAAWRKNGVGGLVKAVDTAAGTVTISSGPKTITIHTTPSTVVRRYSPDSIKFADTRASSLAEIHPGDQLRARGEHSADGSEVTAKEIVAGTFRNIAGTVVSVDAAADTLTVKDLATKQPVVIHVNAQSRMHKLPESMAETLARQFKHSGNAHGKPQTAEEQNQAESQKEAAGNRRASEEVSKMLQSAPAVRISDLHKGDAVMIVATNAPPPASPTAIALLAGVEPLLTAPPAASQSVFSASWDLGGGGGGGGGDSGGDGGGGSGGGGPSK